MKYPETRHDSAVDVYHGISVPDPFRWLENPDSDESRAWIAAQNEVTAAWLQGVNDQRTIRSRIEHLWNYERHGLPQYKQGLYFFTHNHGLQNQAILYVTSDLEGEPRVLLDPNTLSQDGTRALADFAPSNDVKYLAYSVADAGSDWNSWYVRDIASGTDLDDRLAWVKFSRVAWSHDSAGFFYCRYGAPEVELQDINVNQCVWYHRVGTPQSDDILIFEYPDDPQWLFDVKVTDDGETLVLTIWIGTEDKSRIYLIELAKLDLEDTGAHTHISPVRLLDEFDAQYHHIGNDGPIHWFFTTHQAPRGRVIAIDRRTPEAANWHELIAQHRTDTIDSVSHIGGRFIVQYLCNAHTRVAIHGVDGHYHKDITFPTMGSVIGFQGNATRTETFYAFTSFSHPTTIYRYDVKHGDSELLHRPEVDFVPDDYITTQEWLTSTDGTRIPLFLTRHRDVLPNGDAPTLLYGYGGFNIPVTPAFSIATVAWMERGGVYAVANIRGGGEFGQAWHEAGTGTNKQNVFDDFISAAEWLIAHRWTRPDRLAIEGRSNGGLLVGACMTQRPDLFGAVVPGVGVLDMLRYHRFTIGWAWASDYGTADDNLDVFNYLLSYSPVHNTRPGTHYPPTLIMTADHDDRVVPAHSFKFAAALQEAQAGPAPILIRIETRGGHGAGMPTSMQIDSVADKLTFLVGALKIAPSQHHVR